ncbi:CRISPR-associated helicase Cas3' [Arcanobacterium hippocoleae]
MLTQKWLAPRQKEMLARGIGYRCANECEAEIAALVSFVCAVHDLGKLTPAFAIQVDDLALRMENYGFTFSGMTAESRKQLPHALAGEVIFKKLVQDMGWSKGAAKSLASVIGAHHGIPPTAKDVSDASSRAHELGQDQWEAAREELLSWCIRISGAKPYFNHWGTVDFSQPVLALLSGIVITADWIASNTDYFPLISRKDLGYRDEVYFRERLSSAWALIDLPIPWRPHEVDSDADVDAQLRADFSLPPEASARPMQRAAFQEALNTADEPALLLVEDVMGSGKTEAALLAAHILAARQGASGVWITLPTQTTANAMFNRLLTWIAAMEKNDDGTSDFSVQLLHGRANLSDQVQRLKRRGYALRNKKFSINPSTQVDADLNDLQQHIERTAYRQAAHFLPLPNRSCDVGRDEVPAHLEHSDRQNKKLRSRISVHPWESGKKALMADFVVSTIDQLLMVALKSRHLALRHFGASRKIVIIDEVHACDVFMNQYLYRAIEWLGAYGVSVIALSATLDDASRKELLHAYQCGRNYARPKLSRKERGKKWKKQDANLVSDFVIDPQEQEPYPALSVATAHGISTEHVESTQNRSVYVRQLDDSINHFLTEKLRDGGCALVVRNTVKRAQETYVQLQEIFGDDVVLMHARFIGAHRTENDQWLLDNFGKDAREGRRSGRKIVVATQVVEQSLDIDFDLLISDLAPIDVLLQRAGRVHRHLGRVRPVGLENPICWIAEMPQTGEEPNVERGSAAVYGEVLLLRTAFALQSYIGGGKTLRLPDDVRPLMSFVYSEKEEQNLPSEWGQKYAVAKNKFIEKRRKSEKNAETFCLDRPKPAGNEYAVASLDGWVQGHIDGDEDSLIRAGVREGEDTLEVILVDADDAENMATWRLVAGVSPDIPREIPTDSNPSFAQAQALMDSIVRLPAKFTNHGTFERTVEELELLHPSWDYHTPVYGQLVLPLVHGETIVQGCTLRYSRELGLMEVRNDC